MFLGGVATFWVIAQFCVNDKGPSILPQLDGVMGQLSTTVYHWALYAVGIGFLIGAAGWAWSSIGNNVIWGQRAKWTTIGAALGALLIGAGPKIVNALFSAAQSLGC